MGGEEPKATNEMFYREGEGDGSDLVQNNNICNLQKMVSGFFNCICENKEKIVRDPAMKKLVRDYIDNSLETSKYYRELCESLRMEKARQHVLENGLQNETQRVVKEKLLKLTTGEDLLKNFNPRVEPLVKNHKKTRAKLEAKIKGSDQKLMANLIEDLITPLVSLPVFAFNKVFNRTPEKNEKNKAVEVNKCDVLAGDANCAGNHLIPTEVEKLSCNDDLEKLADITEDIKRLGELLMEEDEKLDLEEINKLQKSLILKLDGLCADIGSRLEQLHNEREELIWA